MNFHKLEEFFGSPDGFHMTGSAAISMSIAQFVRDAQKFYVGDVESLNGIKESKELARLPFPKCVFEFEEHALGKRQRGFVFCEDSSPNAAANGDFVAHTVLESYDAWLYIGYVQFDRCTLNSTVYVINHTAQLMCSYSGKSDDAIRQMIWKATSAGFNLVCAFLSVLNCSNVAINEISAPKFRNQKRKAKNLVPIYSYKTLVLKTRQRLLSALGGTHDSPRIHLRRGHIKHRKTGDFWWQPCVVGDRKRGVVMKDYRADRLVATQPLTLHTA
jgi:hypothetical protein